MFNLMNKQNGFSLVELLATLVIAGIILTFVGSLMVKAVNTYDQTATENALRDEADIIMAIINRDVFPLDASKIRKIESNCENIALSTPCSNGAWLLLNDGSQIGFNNNEIKYVGGAYKIQNKNIKIVDFRVCYIPENKTINEPVCDDNEEEDITDESNVKYKKYPTYVFKLTLSNEKKKQIKTSFSNEISIIYQ